MQISLPYLYSNLHCQGNETTFDPKSVLESNSHPFMAVRRGHAKGRRFEKQRVALGFQARGKRRAGFSSASAVRVVRQGVGWADEAVGVRVKRFWKRFCMFYLFIYF